MIKSIKASFFLLAMLLILLYPLFAASQQTPTKTDEKKKSDKQETTKGQESEKKATESDLKAPEDNINMTTQDMTGGQSDIWNPQNRRDPFASLLQKVSKSGGEEYRVILKEGKRPEGIEGMELKDIELVGIFFVKGAYKAMFVGSDDLPYLLKTGDQIWDGRIKEVDINCVTLEQETEDLRFLVRRMKQVKKCLETE